jgi:predicted O-methyltransferase YrrM
MIGCVNNIKKHLLKKIVDQYKTRLIRKIFAEKVTGEITLMESKFLGEIVRNIGDDGPIIEIGTLFGRSTLTIAENKNKFQKLITVDNYSWNPIKLSPENHFAFTKFILSEAISDFNVEQLKMDKNIFYENYNGNTPEMVFFDAVHSYIETCKDILWAKKIKAKVICGHDYSEKSLGVKEAVNEFGGLKSKSGTLWVLK